MSKILKYLYYAFAGYGTYFLLLKFIQAAIQNLSN